MQKLAAYYQIGGRIDMILFEEITPPDWVGVTRVRSVSISPDEKSYAYTYTRRNGTLYLLDSVH